MDRRRLLTDPDLQLAVIDLGLFARSGLEAHRGQLRPLPLGPIGLQKALHLLIAAGVAKARQLPIQHHAIPAHLGPASLGKRDELIDWPWPRSILPGLPRAESEPALDGLAINPEFARDPLGAFAALRTRYYLPHQICAHHPLLRHSRWNRLRNYLIQSLFHAPFSSCRATEGGVSNDIKGGVSPDC
jgi:hypothetical protein